MFYDSIDCICYGLKKISIHSLERWKYRTSMIYDPSLKSAENGNRTRLIKNTLHFGRHSRADEEGRLAWDEVKT